MGGGQGGGAKATDSEGVDRLAGAFTGRKGKGARGWGTGGGGGEGRKERGG